MSGSDLTIDHGDERRARRRSRVADHAHRVSFPCGRAQVVVEHVEHEVDRAVDGGGDGGGQADALVERRGLAPDDDDALDRAAEPRQHAEHRRPGSCVWASSAGALASCGIASTSGSRTATVPGGSPIGIASTSTSSVVAVEQLVGEVDAADAEVGDPHAVGHRRARRAVGDLDAEAVVAEEDVADPGDEHPRSRRRSHRTARPRRGGRTGSGPATRAASVAGSSSTVTATCSSPSTSWNTPATVASMPARNMSWASARRRRAQPHAGARARPRRRRRRTVSVHGSTAASTAGSHHGSRLGSAAARRAGDASGSCRAGAPTPRAACRRSGRRSPPPAGRCRAPPPSPRRSA